MVPNHDKTHQLDDRMESFFLSETLKYLYLLFDDEHFIHTGTPTVGLLYSMLKAVNHHKSDNSANWGYTSTGNYIFNTEGHFYPVLPLLHDRRPTQSPRQSTDAVRLSCPTPSYASQVTGKREFQPS